MSYQVLARKWRPRFFDEMVGQEHVLRALINALNEGRLHHAYLFTGTRGVGKTTIARILAKCLNCEEGVSARPCGTCTSCREIAEGRFVDLIEVDAASRTRVEDTRELLDNVQYAPTRGRFKVYLIDEVHMLSTHSFNALLKTLEEPPEHVKFLLATTDPQKLPVTILSRCLQFSLKNMTPERIVGYLGKVLDAESVPYDEPALWSLGRAAQGSMRDALSLTDQAIAFGEGEIHDAQVNAMLGSMDRGRLFRLAEVMAKADAAEILAETASMAEHSPDYDEILQGLLHIWHRASLAQVVPDAIDNAEGDREAILQLSMAMPAEDLQLCYQIALQGRQDLAIAPDPRQGFEMILLRMLAFRPAPESVPELDLVSALEKKKAIAPDERRAVQPVQSASEVKPASGAKPEFGEPSETHDVARPSVEESSRPEADSLESDGPESDSPESNSLDASVNQAEPQKTEDDSARPDIAQSETAQTEVAELEVTGSEVTVPEVPALGVTGSEAENSPLQPPASDQPASKPLSSLMDGSAGDSSVGGGFANVAANVVANVAAKNAAPTIESTIETTVETPSESAPESLDASALPEIAAHTWHLWVDHLTLAGLPMAIARNSALVSVSGSAGSLILEFDVDPAQGALYNDTQRQRIAAALAEHLPGVSLTMSLTPPRGETPEQRRQRLLADALYSARQAIDSDPVVNQIVAELGGQVIDETVRPNS
ncbi:MAG: DNA polymerase III subunit gamma/tau [Pseudomonadota bacterium]|jgi:DNA polymerase-3 subunit gamma/tau|nr:DNA polymerase III subunit gamma/tau [Pseudomonadota bacterium]|tara:strand:- start:1085 stop:3229 length:2145 start_codon:yes stop_codon:yes gene_type:complete